MDWFQRLTGFAEGDYWVTQARLRVDDGWLHSEADGRRYAVGRFELVSLAALRARAYGIRLPGGALTLGTLDGDVQRLHADPDNAGAVFQVASQFNMLEMISPSVTPEHGVTGYALDRTQGPGCAIAAGAGTIWRNYLVPLDGQIGQTASRQLNGIAALGDALSAALAVEPGALWQMRNGYLLPDHQQLARIEAHLAGLDEAERDQLRGALRFGLHQDVEVTERDATPGTLVTQVYCSALPIRYTMIPERHWTGFATLILEAAYEATLLAAVLNAARGGSRRVLLTRLGGGAFGNADAWINRAILRALRLTAGQGLDVQLVSVGAPSSATRALHAAWQNDV